MPHSVDRAYAAALAERQARLEPWRRYLVTGPTDLHPKQRAFLALTEREALYGGAAGGGKTEALLCDALQYAHFPQFKALILRRTFPALNLPDSIMNRAIQWLGTEHWNAESKRFTLPSGAVIQFGYCDSDGDLDRYKSAQFHWIGIDELTEWPEAWYTFLFSRARKATNDPIPIHIRAGTNPDGAGAEWVRRRFRIPLDSVVHEAIRGEDRVFLPARAEDNPSLDLVDYERSLVALGPSRYAQLRWGKWSRDAEGLVYDGFSERINVLESLPPPDLANPWRKLLCLDFGVLNRNSISLLQWRKYDPCLYAVFSYRFAGGPSELAAEVSPLYHQHKPERLIGDTGGMGKAFESEFTTRFGLPVTAAEKHDKLGNIALLNSALRSGQIKVLRPTCKDLIEEWSTLPWAEKRMFGKQEAHGFNNHCADGVLYGYRASIAYAERAKPPEPTLEERIRAETNAEWEREYRRTLEAEQAEREQFGGAYDFSE